jgi:Glycosyltransferase family 87
VNRRLPLALGLGVLAFVAGCAAVAWPSDSGIAAAPGGHQLGDPVWSRLYLGFAATAFVLYVVAALLVSRRSTRLAALAVLAAAIQLAPLAGPLLLSTDAWTYWSYGRIAAVHHESPYTMPPSAFPRDPSYPYVGDAWRHTTSVYGPGFTLASEPLALASGSSANAAAWIYKVLAALAMLTAALLAARLSRRPALALVLVGWNPAMALDFAGGGHNDAWMAALVVAALALAASGRRQLAGAAWAAASLVKWVPLALLPLRALEARATGRPVRHLGFAVTAAALVVVATIAYGFSWLRAVVPLLKHAQIGSKFSLPDRLEQLGVPHEVALWLCIAGLAAGYVWLLLEAHRGRARLGLAAGLILVATPYLAAWYVVWALPLAAAEDDAPATWLAVGLSAYLLRQAVPL